MPDRASRRVPACLCERQAWKSYMWLCRGGTVLEVMAELMGRTSGASKVRRCLLPAYKLLLSQYVPACAKQP